jgi:hypothetical protein
METGDPTDITALCKIGSGALMALILTESDSDVLSRLRKEWRRRNREGHIPDQPEVSNA